MMNVIFLIYIIANYCYYVYRSYNSLVHYMLKYWINIKKGDKEVDDKQIEMMKKLIEEKKKKSSRQSYNTKVNLNIVENTKSIKRTKKGGLFDK